MHEYSPRAEYQLFHSLQDRLNEESNTLKLTIKDLKLFIQIRDKSLILNLFSIYKKTKLILPAKDFYYTCEIPIDNESVFKQSGFNMFDRMMTPDGPATLIGYGKYAEKFQQNLFLYIDHDRGIAFHGILTNKEKYAEKKFYPLTESSLYYIFPEEFLEKYQIDPERHPMFANLLAKLASQLSNNLNTIALKLDDLKLIGKFSSKNKLCLLDILLSYNKTHFITKSHDGKKYKIHINTEITKQKSGFNQFENINAPTNKILIGYAYNEFGTENLFFLEEDGLGIIYLTGINSAAALKAMGYVSQTHQYQKRLIRAIKANDEEKISHTLYYIWEYFSHLNTENLLSFSLVKALNKKDLKILKFFFDELTEHKDFFNPNAYDHFICDCLLYAIQNYHSELFEFLIFNYHIQLPIDLLKKILLKLENNIPILRTLFARGVFTSELADMIMTIPFDKEIRNLSYSVHYFYKALAARIRLHAVELLCQSLDYDPEMGLMLLQSTFESAIPITQTQDLLRLRGLLSVVKFICTDPNYKELQNYFDPVFTTLLGISFDEEANKDAFIDNKDKSDFFKKNFSDLIPGLNVMTSQDNELIKSKIKSDSNNTDNAVFNNEIQSQAIAVSYLTRLEFLCYDLKKREEINELLDEITLKEVKIDLDQLTFILNSLPLILKEKALRKLGELYISKTKENYPAYLYFSKAFLMGDEESLAFLKNMNEEGSKYELFDIFSKYFRQIHYSVPKEFQNTNQESIQDQARAIKFIEEIIPFCLDIMPDLATYMGFLYAKPEFSFFNIEKSKYWFNIAFADLSTHIQIKILLADYKKSKLPESLAVYLKDLTQPMNFPTQCTENNNNSIVSEKKNTRLLLTSFKILKLLIKEPNSMLLSNIQLKNLYDSLIETIEHLQTKINRVSLAIIANKKSDQKAFEQQQELAFELECTVLLKQGLCKNLHLIENFQDVYIILKEFQKNLITIAENKKLPYLRKFLNDNIVIFSSNQERSSHRLSY